MKEALGTVALIAITLLVLAGMLIGVGWISRAVNLEGMRVFGPAEAEAERQIVQETKVFIDSMNGASLDDIMAWNSLRDEIAKSTDETVAAAYISQQQGIVEMICQRVGRMDANTVDANVRAFLVERGNNCR